MGYELKIIAADGLPYDQREFDVTFYGMASFRTSMWRLGMLATGYDQEDLPRAETEAAIVARIGRAPKDEGEFYFSEEGTDYCTWRPTIRDAVSGEINPLPGIAVHKLSSNDYWCVTADECRQALEAWRAALSAASHTSNPSRAEERCLIARAICGQGRTLYEVFFRLADSWAETGAESVNPLHDAELAGHVDAWFEWLAFLERAAEHEGFVVW